MAFANGECLLSFCLLFWFENLLIHKVEGGRYDVVLRAHQFDGVVSLHIRLDLYTWCYQSEVTEPFLGLIPQFQFCFPAIPLVPFVHDKDEPALHDGQHTLKFDDEADESGSRTDGSSLKPKEQTK